MNNEELAKLVGTLPFRDANAWEAQLPQNFCSILRSASDFPLLIKIANSSGSPSITEIALDHISTLLDNVLPPEVQSELNELFAYIASLPKVRFLRVHGASKRLQNHLQIVNIISCIDLFNPTLEDARDVIDLLPAGEWSSWHNLFLKSFLTPLCTSEGIPTLVKICKNSGSEYLLEDAILTLNEALTRFRFDEDTLDLGSLAHDLRSHWLLSGRIQTSRNIDRIEWLLARLDEIVHSLRGSSRRSVIKLVPHDKNER